jgi:hypothetical protein
MKTVDRQRSGFMADDDDDRVGFGRPPKASRFRPGQSGNPGGRPKGSRNLLTDLRAELSSATTITERGCQLTVTKQVAIVKSLVAAAIDGDMRAVAALVNLSTRMAAAEDHQQDDAQFSAEEAEIVQEFHSRKLNSQDEHQAPPNPNSARDSNDRET